MVNKPKFKIHTENCGNVHAAANFINAKDWAQYLINITAVSSGAIAVFKMPAEMVYKIRSGPSYCCDPHHDDPGRK